MAEREQEIRPIKKGSLSVVHGKGDILTNTVGRIGSIPVNIIVGTPGAIFKNIPESRVNELKETYKDFPWQGNVEVYLNHSPLFRQLRRLFQKDRRTHFLFRLTFGVTDTVAGWLYAKFFRGDFYNPFNETVTSYHPNKAVNMHEIGHAQDFDKVTEPTLRAMTSFFFPVYPINLEWKASRNAMKYLEKGEREQAKKVLEPAFGSYFGILSIPFQPIRILLAPIGILAGHIHSRLFKHNIFYNGDPVNKTPEQLENQKRLFQTPQYVG